jgi:PAS domain S-box-containing protein
MTLFVGQAGSLERQYASQAAGFVAVIIAGAALIGWWAGLPLLSSWGWGPAMRPLGAFCLAALGFALVHPGKDFRLAFAIGLPVAALGMLGLVLVLFNVELDVINRWLPWWAAVPGLGETSFRVASAPTIVFGLAGASLALSRFQRHHFDATMLGCVSGAISVFALLGYLTGIDTLYGSVSVNSPPLPTAVGLLCVAGGIILRIGTTPALRKPRPLWHLLVMLGCAIIAPLLLFGAYAGFRIADAQLHQVWENLTIGARTLSADVDREIIGEIERLQALAASPSLRQSDFAEFQRQAEASLALRQSGNIMLVDRNMQQLVNTWVPFGTHLERVAVPEPIERALATGKPQITGLFMGPVTHQLMFGIIVPVQIDGENRYALVRSPNQHTLGGLVVANQMPAGWHAVVSDAARRIIARSDRSDEDIGQELPPSQWHGAQPIGLFEFVDSKGRSSLEAYAWSELTGWETAVWAPKALLEAPVRAQWRTLGATALMAIALVVALASWLGRIIARSVGHAARATIASGEGGPVLPGGTPVAEINTLMAELRETTNLLRESEATFRAMFEVSSVGKIEVEPKTGRFLRANSAMCEFVGYSEAELRARTVFEITHPDDRDRDRELLRRMVAGELAVFDLEKRYIRKDGKAVWARVTANIIRDESGRPLRDTAVIVDINARKQAEQALQASKDRLQLTLNAAQLGSYQYDPLHRVFSGDKRCQEILDFPKNEATIDKIMKLVHPDDVEMVRANLEAALDPVDPRRSATEYRLHRGNGAVRWVESNGLAYFEGEGPERRAVSYVGTLADITERKGREEKEHLLMREVNHRAKNMLSVVDAIAHQTATKNPEDFIERFSERIQALSANQDLLVRNEWNGVDIKDLVHAQLAHFADLIGSRIAVHGPKLRLRAASAQAIGLALHELTTNAGKYGALSTDTGRVDVCWGVDRDTFTMSWIEREGPPVSAPKRRGFGTIVMEAMAERSLDGTVDLDYPPSGMTWRLTCPAANALEPREREISAEGEDNLSGAASDPKTDPTPAQTGSADGVLRPSLSAV